MADREPETELTAAQRHYNQVVTQPTSEDFARLERRLGDQGVRMPDLTGDVYDIVMHGQLVGSIIMEAFSDNPDAHINPGELRLKIGEIATLREIDKAQYIASRQQWLGNVRRYQDTHPEIIAAQSLKTQAENHPLHPLISHVLLSMGALLDDSEDNTATLGRAVQPPQQVSA